jgi:hypothetical protein
METNEIMTQSRRLLQPAADGFAPGHLPLAARAAGETACRGVRKSRC